MKSPMESSLDKTQFNSLETAVLQWFAERYNDENLSAQIKAAKVKERRWTKAGFYVDLDIPLDVAPTDVKNLESQEVVQGGRPVRKGWPIAGPEIESEDIEDGGGSLLWGKDGRITAIEMYAYGHLFKENIANFTLSPSCRR
jgi:hypothetical protein